MDGKRLREVDLGVNEEQEEEEVVEEEEGNEKRAFHAHTRSEANRAAMRGTSLTLSFLTAGNSITSDANWQKGKKRQDGSGWVGGGEVAGGFISRRQPW